MSPALPSPPKSPEFIEGPRQLLVYYHKMPCSIGKGTIDYFVLMNEPTLRTIFANSQPLSLSLTIDDHMLTLLDPKLCATTKTIRPGCKTVKIYKLDLVPDDQKLAFVWGAGRGRMEGNQEVPLEASLGKPSPISYRTSSRDRGLLLHHLQSCARERTERHSQIVLRDSSSPCFRYSGPTVEVDCGSANRETALENARSSH